MHTPSLGSASLLRLGVPGTRGPGCSTFPDPVDSPRAPRSPPSAPDKCRNSSPDPSQLWSTVAGPVGIWLPLQAPSCSCNNTVCPAPLVRGLILHMIMRKKRCWQDVSEPCRRPTVGWKSTGCESCESRFIGGKMRTIAWETAFQKALRNCPKEAGRGQNTHDSGEVGSTHKHAAFFRKPAASHEEQTSPWRILVLL